MVNTPSEREHASKACAACRSKKRKCDRVLPACTRCARLYQNCQYDSEPNSRGFPGLVTEGTPESLASHFQRIVPTGQAWIKSRQACSKCRVGKRQCSRDVPSCERCMRTGSVCRYDGLEREESADTALSSLLLPSMGLAEVVDGHHAPKSFPTYAETDVTEDSNVPNADDIEYRTNCTMEEIAKGVSLQYQGDEHNFAVTSRIPSPLTIDHTSHHYLDPFHTYPSNLSRETITRTFHYSLQEMWPRLFPGLKHKGKSFTHEWMQLALGCTPLFRAWLHSGAEHLMMRQKASGRAQSPTSRKDTYELLLMRQDAIVALKNAVNDDRPNTVTDQIIMAAFALALHPHERHQVAASRMRAAPLSNLQWLTRFTDIVILDGHVKGIRHLVQARGGIEKLEMPGLLEGLSTWDLITSSKMLTKPFWPLRTKLQLESAARFLAKFENKNSTIGDFHALLWSEFPHSIMWVFHALRGYSSLLEGHSHGRFSDLDLGYILDLRNLIHYQVLSLPSAMDDKVGTVSHTYESFRLAQTIYSLLVLFPVPLTTTPYPELARLLRYELEMVSEEGWAMIPTLLLWILALGGIGALGTPHRLWFVQKLHMQLGNLGIISWEGFVHIMSTLIWLDSPCGIEGLILWKEIQQYGHQLLAEYKPTLASVCGEPARLDI